MLHDGFDIEMLALHGNARVADLAATMRGARGDGARVMRARRWTGVRLVRIGRAMARSR